MSQAHTLRERLQAAQLLSARQLPCGDLALAKSLALAGIGVTILPRRVAATEQQGQLWRLHADLPFTHDQVYLAYRADLHRTRAALRLKDALVEQGQRLERDAESQHIQAEISTRPAPEARR
jgi:DNA-binding transcriptional LysR family regulator